MRLLGFIGLVPLAMISLFALGVSLLERDWKGILLMAFMSALLTFFAITLWRGAKLERGEGNGKLAHGWAGESVTTFVRSVVIRSLEGRILICGAAASIVAAIFSVAWPGAIGISPEKSAGIAVLFGLWPVVSFTFFVHVCGPHYRMSLVTTLATIAAAVFPFYVAYS